MRIEQLEYVTAVTTYGSLRRASEALHISQPALSEAITKLEKELGIKLLERRRSGSRISNEGLTLLGEMTEVLDALERLRTTARRRQRTRAVRIGTVSAAGSSVLSPALLGARERSGPGTFDVATMPHNEVLRALSEGTLDIGIINALTGDEWPAGLSSHELIKAHPVSCLRADDPLAAHDKLSLDHLRARPLVAMREGFTMARVSRQLFGTTPPETTYVADGAEAGKTMVADGLGIALLPEFSITGDARVEANVLTSRAIAASTPLITLTVLHRTSDRLPESVKSLLTGLTYYAERAGAGRQPGPRRA